MQKKIVLSLDLYNPETLEFMCVAVLEKQLSTDTKPYYHSTIYTGCAIAPAVNIKYKKYWASFEKAEGYLTELNTNFREKGYLTLHELKIQPHGINDAVKLVSLYEQLFHRYLKTVEQNKEALQQHYRFNLFYQKEKLTA